ncbi:MAG: AI-2E family transporter [Myxococcales bacterium]|nr:AI-2E family transporter [Myxococcales bacterium]
MKDTQPMQSGDHDNTISSSYVQRLAKLLFFGVLGYVVYLVLSQIAGVLSVLLISLLFAYVLDPLVDWLENRRVPRTAAIGLIVVVCAVAIFGMALWILPPLVAEFRGLADRVVAWLGSDAHGPVTWLGEKFDLDIEQHFSELKTKLREAAPMVLSRLGNWAAGAATSALAAVSSFLNLIIVPVLVFYFLKDFDVMTEWVGQQIPPRYRPFVLPRAHRANSIVGEWLRGQVQVAVMLAILYAIGLSIVGIKLAIPVGILSGLLNVIPYLGTSLGIGLALLLSLLEWNGIVGPIGVVAVFVTAQLLESYVLTPRIVGEKVGLSPVATLIALLVGGEAFGLMGIIIAVPIAGALKVFVGEGLDWYRESRLFVGDAGDQSEKVSGDR